MNAFKMQSSILLEKYGNGAAQHYQYENAISTYLWLRYFCGRDVCTDEWLHSIVNYDILPMLSEYWFDDPNKLQRWENILQGVFQ